MVLSNPRLRRYATATAFMALAFALQNCGVMSSSSDCAQRATCSSGDGIEGGNDSGGPGTDAGDDASGLDATMTDVTSEDVVVGNDVEEGGEDAPGETAVEDAPIADVTTEKSAADGPCVPTGSAENCTNGIDDNCDGLVDCAEPSCQTAGYACVGAAPAGWSGPDLFWTGTAGATAPACPTGYRSMDGHAGPTGTNGTCACTCTATGQACTATAAFHKDQACSDPACSSVTLTATSTGPSACTPITPPSVCGNAGSFDGGVPAPTGGTCTPQVTKTPGSAEGWTSSARVCTAPADVPGGCAGASQQCVLESPSSFGAAICVHQSGVASCPAGYPTKSLIYGDETDMRGCGPCTCSAKPTGGTCAATINVWGDQAGGCTGSVASTSALSTTCTTYSGANYSPGYAQGNFTVTPGTCTVVTQPTPTGAVIGTGPVTVCCAN